jgi:rhodanese-related sulfurtransferase
MLESGISTGPGSKSDKMTSQVAMITREEILARLNDPSLLLVNVMPKETFADGHIPRSLNLPLSEIETKARQLFPDIGRELVIYCGGPT